MERSFQTIRDEYDCARIEQLKKIVSELRKNGYEAELAQGKSDYTASHTMEAYNHSLWRYINATKNNRNYLVTIQPFHIDPADMRLTTLNDRIGVYAYRKKYDNGDAVKQMKITDIDLPMDEEKLHELIIFLENL